MRKSIKLSLELSEKRQRHNELMAKGETVDGRGKDRDRNPASAAARNRARAEDGDVGGRSGRTGGRGKPSRMTPRVLSGGPSLPVLI